VIYVASIVAWAGALVVVLGSVGLAILAIRLRQPAIGLIGLLPIVAGIVAIALDLRIAPPHDAVWAVVALGLAALGVIGGNPITVWILARAARGDVDRGDHGGIVVTENGGEGKEVLRGGTWIGYLERIAVVAGIMLLRFEVIAAVIAIKGLGRFSELDTAQARERFIIGTLVSMIWAGACAALIVL
jgi:hypothetical protein